jgi:two-component system OmpR family response regulator
MQILLAEDDIETAEFVAQGLSELGHNILRAGNGTDALHIATTEALDVAILDRLLPQLDGLSVLRRLRAARIDTPVLLLTALGRIEDRVEGLEAGADDYLVKPFAFSELAARINALGRRPPISHVITEIEIGPLRIDLLKREVRRDGRVIALHFDPQTNIVETHISRLRAKLNEGGGQDLIETVRGVGYRMRGHG